MENLFCCNSVSWGWFTKVSRALEDILSKFVYYRNLTSGEKFKLKLCTWAQSIALGTRTKFQLKILTINVISGIVYFREIILESSRNLSETTPRPSNQNRSLKLLWQHSCLAMCNFFTDFGLNTLRPRQNGRHLPDNIFKCIFLNENVWISIKISLKFVPKVPINNIPALVLIMARRWPGDKPLSEPMMVSLPTHICVTRPQWVKPEQNKMSIEFE